MKSSATGEHPLLSALSKNANWFLLWGVILLVLGIVAISVAALTTLISVIFIGFVFLISGVVVLFDTFKFWWRKGSGFFLHLIMGLLYVAVGYMLVLNPILGSVSLTLVLGTLFIFLGIFRLTYALSLRSLKWRWVFLNGLISLLIGILILVNWPASSLLIIGLFVGIDLIFAGIAYILAGLSGRALSNAK